MLMAQIGTGRAGGAGLDHIASRAIEESFIFGSAEKESATHVVPQDSAKQKARNRGGARHSVSSTIIP